MDWVTPAGLASYNSFITSQGAVFAIETVPLGMFLIGLFFFVLVWGGTPFIEKYVNKLMDFLVKVIHRLFD